ncbi:NAD(P)H-hydrate epimerase [Alteribacillus persepolensis]|uniref:Bifunctional NAD(P)H-hydrate repair enzyme n=1 Tax=Alteribacillus persepolensis TaxID=568899 RepID=A0A1G8FGD8_9BACI|nr:NAD(P)H-hydrate dehydratase [Alteribacillus persepolensis]SDH81221.1 NAD(P)H-hydrate epimerase [Alteribacillus persepolensis]
MQVVTGEEMRQVDRFAIEDIGMREEVLMENAGRAWVEQLEKLYAGLCKKKIAVLVGKGNNGGDGFVIARTLLDRGFHVDVWLLAAEEQWKGAAKYHKRLFESCGYEGKNWDVLAFMEKAYDLCVDAMLGTGATGALRYPYSEAADCLNKSGSIITAVDIPSGVPAGEGDVAEEAVQADATITLQSAKCSAYLFPARSYYGDITAVDIGIPQSAWSVVHSKRSIWTKSDVALSLPERSPSSHKGDHGKGLIVGGSFSMPGAVSMTASACIYSGAGLLTTALPASILSIVSNSVPETMFLPLPEKNGYIAGEVMGTDFTFGHYDAVAAGPGLGRERGGKQLIRKLLAEVKTPLLFDADALYYLPELKQEMKQREEPVIVTPHAGEMARLADVSIQEVNKHRFSISKEFARAYNCYVVLKGPYTIVTSPEGEQSINPTGNEALARGGTGDILTGIALGFMLQHRDVFSALCNAVYIHGLTADLALQKGFTATSMASSDLIHQLPLAFRTIVSSL